MIVRTLRFGFKAETDTPQLAEIRSALSRLAASQYLALGVVGQDLGDPSEGFSLAYTVAFADMAALRRYVLEEPLHRAADFTILPHVSQYADASVSDDADPDLRAKIHALWEERLAGDPEVAALFASLAGVFSPAAD
jgi:hypothetical protein